MKEQKLNDQLQDALRAPLKRKSFLKYTAISGAAMIIGLDSCTKSNNGNTPGTTTIDVGAGDTGILNFAYALEQLEAAFYTQVNASFYAGITPAEQSILTDIWYHEIIHRNFFKRAAGNN